ncbi:MAG: hypothetical protein RR602_09070 [Longicatena sp.]|uniref:hypothetical protein n=1 Tax=Anaerorhabdus sp. TaxID=1872524 RepID=UPI002FCAFDA7
MVGIDGVKIHKVENYSLCYVNSFSDEFKERIRDKLSFICHGKSDAESMRSIFNYKSTLSEFLKRYEERSDERQKGMMGELLTHVIINDYFPEYDVASAFFNLEEKNVKKGFDVVLYSHDTDNTLITEVKSGNLHKNKNSTQTINDLINTAKRDLIERLNDSDNRSLWMNAINHAKKVYDSQQDLKNIIMDILDKQSDDMAQTSQNKDVILVGVLFNTLNDAIVDESISTKSSQLNKDNLFNSVFCMAIQKETYQKIYEFLKEESQ